MFYKQSNSRGCTYVSFDSYAISVNLCQYFKTWGVMEKSGSLLSFLKDPMIVQVVFLLGNNWSV